MDLQIRDFSPTFTCCRSNSVCHNRTGSSHATQFWDLKFTFVMFRISFGLDQPMPVCGVDAFVRLLQHNTTHKPFVESGCCTTSIWGPRFPQEGSMGVGLSWILLKKVLSYQIIWTRH